jgi:transcriptional regulator with XRE-family HTH domain
VSENASQRLRDSLKEAKVRLSIARARNGKLIEEIKRLRQAVAAITADFTEREMRNLLVAKAKAAGSQAALAKKLGLSAAYLSDVILGRRDVRRVAERLGYKAETFYRKERP